MSADATNPPKGAMDCTMASREEILESYLTGRLSEEGRDAFEEHYFGCARCFGELQTLQAIRDELPRVVAALEGTPARWLSGWASAAALAAVLVLAVGAVLWMRPSVVDVPETTELQLPSQPERPGVPQPGAPGPAVAAGPSSEQLARFEPPRYEPLTLRGMPDEATARFHRGMEQYRKGDYGGAVEQLRLAAELNPEAAHISFFLGVCHLLLEQDEAGIARLRATVALGDTPYLEEAHFYLAKAFLRRKDPAAAEAQLTKAIQIRGALSEEARRLLTQVRKLNERPD